MATESILTPDMTPETTHCRWIETLLNRATSVLTHHRLLHVLGVTHTACTLAERAGIDVGHAALAGLLHDISKDHKPKAMEAELSEWGITIPPEDRDFPRTWHGFHAAQWAAREMGLDVPEVLEAATLHTTADAGITPLTQALYVADFCEPGRQFDVAPDVFAAACEDLPTGFRMALLAKGRHLVRKPVFKVHPRAWRAMHDYLTPGQIEVLEDLARTHHEASAAQG